MATDSTGGTLIVQAEISSGGTVPIGFIKTAGDALLNPFIDGDYDAWLFPTAAEATANDTTNAVQIADNLNADPNVSLVGQFEAWSATVPAGGYDVDDIVYATDTNYYISLVNSNLNFEPSANPTKWQLIPVKDMIGLDNTQTLTNKTLTAPTITGPDIDKVVDSNGNEVVIYGETVSAVNEITETNAATGNAPKLEATGDNTDIDLDINSKGTGDVNVNGYPVYGFVVLDTPEVLSSATTTGSWVTVNSTTLNIAAARKAIIRIKATGTDTPTGTAEYIRVYIRKAGSGLAIGNNTLIGSSSDTVATAAAINITVAGETTVNLDASYDFDYYIEISAGMASLSFSINLVGYYV
jgi:hypothetical protein